MTIQYQGGEASDQCLFCKRPFRNGEIFGVLPENPYVTACAECAPNHYANDDMLLMEVHLTGQPIKTPEEIADAHRAIKLFHRVLDGDEDDDEVGPINETQRAYLQERLTALIAALNDIKMVTLPEGKWGVGQSSR